MNLLTVFIALKTLGQNRPVVRKESRPDRELWQQGVPNELI